MPSKNTNANSLKSRGWDAACSIRYRKDAPKYGQEKQNNTTTCRPVIPAHS